MTPREFSEELERKTLSEYAMLSANTRGRDYPIKPCDLRTEFIRDRDRILHCKSFRRMKHKTQVFLAPQGDHYRTRLTHTLEVTQIARTISRALRLNEDLTEAIGLGHDLGHTPFGHSGEAVLNELVPGGFKHNVQSLRVVEKLENDGRGLNLTYEVRDGIVNHTSHGNPCTMEGKVVSISDRIAYLNHDIDDAIRAGVISNEDLPADCVRVLGATHGDRINTIILDVVHCSEGKPDILMSEDIKTQFKALREFMFERVYYNPTAKKEEGKAKKVVEMLFHYYLDHMEELPEDFLKFREEDGDIRIVADWVACMTDTYAINDFKRLFVPDAFR